MATFVSRRAVKLAAAASVLPALGLPAALRLKPVLAEDKADDSTKRTIYRACDLPLDDHLEKEQAGLPCQEYPRNAVEENISVARKVVWEMGSTFMSQIRPPLDKAYDQFETISDKVNTGVEHTKKSLFGMSLSRTVDYIQNNPEGLPRVALICVAGMGGVVLGYKGGILRKLVYSTIAVGSTAALCYPKTTVELSGMVADSGRELVDKYWPFGEEKTDEKPPVLTSVADSAQKEKAAVVKTSDVKKDEGQSNPKDKDMYSTRGS